LRDAATTEGECAKGIVGTGETTIDIGLKNPNGEGSYRTVNHHIFTGLEGQKSPFGDPRTHGMNLVVSLT
jgi:hypothetical protein